MISRRGLVGMTLLVLPGASDAFAAPDRAAEAATALAALEREHGGRLGVAILAGKAAPVAYRGSERFALCSTFKALLAAFVLWRAERGRDSMDRRIVYGREVLQPYAPTTSQHVGAPGLTLAALCEAAVTLSDNTAANLLLDAVGGPGALTAWLRDTGDLVTRLDNGEPALNDVPPGQEHDTTTPLTMAATLQRLLFGSILADASRRQLEDWLVGSRTGDARLRAGLPRSWRVGDKTGTFRTTANDVAVVFAPSDRQRVVAAYYVGGSGSDGDRDAVLAAVGRIAASL